MNAKRGSGSDEFPGLCGGTKPLKGEPHECLLSENGRTVGGGVSRWEVEKTLSGTVAGGMGLASISRLIAGAPDRLRLDRTWTPPSSSAVGDQKIPGEVLGAERLPAGATGHTVKWSRTPREDRPRSRVLGLGQRKKHRMGHALRER